MIVVDSINEGPKEEGTLVDVVWLDSKVGESGWGGGWVDMPHVSSEDQFVQMAKPHR